MQNSNVIATGLYFDYGFNEKLKHIKYDDIQPKLPYTIQSVSLLDSHFYSIARHIKSEFYTDKSKLEEKYISPMTDVILEQVKLKFPNIRLVKEDHFLRFNELPNVSIDFEKVDLFNGTPITLANSKISLKKVKTLFISNPKRITSNVLGLFTIPNIKIYFSEDTELWVKIVKKHLETDKDILECQEELIENGLKEYAKL